MDFLGSFHPVVLHLPIGGLVAAFLLEVFQNVSRKVGYDSPIRFLLAFTAITAVLSALFGFWLAQKGNYQGINFQIHQWSGIGVAVFTCIFFLIKSKLGRIAKWMMWSINLLVLVLAGHFGGSLTHGENFLLADAPDFLKIKTNTSRNTSENIHPDSLIVFADIIQPIIRNKCSSCHNETKKQGNLDLSTAKSWINGGKSGRLYDTEKPLQSLLFQRIYLPVEHEEHMPPGDQPQLLPSEVALLEWWIESGMSFEANLNSISFGPRVETALAERLRPFDPYQVLDVRPISPSLLRAFSDEGINVLPISQKSPLLEVNMAGKERINDEQLLLLLEAKDQIVRLNFQSSGIIDNQLKMVGAFSNLIHLSLHNTPISDEGLKHLMNLKYLQVLNLHSTQVSDISIPVLQGLPYLQSVFLWNTRISEVALKSLKEHNPTLNLGLL